MLFGLEHCKFEVVRTTPAAEEVCAFVADELITQKILGRLTCRSSSKCLTSDRSVYKDMYRKTGRSHRKPDHIVFVLR